MSKKTKIALGIPLDFHTIYADAADSIWQLDKPCDMVKVNAGGDGISQMRNRIVKQAYEHDCTHVLMLDSDMIYPPDTITKLLSHDLDIVGGLTFKRWPPYDPMLRVGEPYKLQLLYPYPEGLVEVTATGAACLLIKMSVFDQIDVMSHDEPFFELDFSPEGKPVGEDINFCYKAGYAGIDIYVDTTVETSHLFLMRANRGWFELYQKIQMASLKKQVIGGN